MPLLVPKPLKIITKGLFLVLALALFSGAGLVVWTKSIVKSGSQVAPPDNIPNFEVEPDRFPVGVNILEKEITEDPLVDWYVSEHLSININKTRQNRLIDRVLAELIRFDWYQQLASSVSRILAIFPGERKEEIVKNFGDILHWSKEDRDKFSNLIVSYNPALAEGKFFPGRYVVEAKATPEEVATLLEEKFTEDVLSRYDLEVEKQVPLKDALVIASLLEREAYDFTDMRLISGVIWNRLFIDMPLQLDASLQYARGSKKTESAWWPKVKPADKYIDSPYNTYENEGLPPAPISNPSIEAIIAAINPRVTDCMFYFHDKKGGFYCTKTYEEHVAKLKQIYGKGR